MFHECYEHVICHVAPLSVSHVLTCFSTREESLKNMFNSCKQVGSKGKSTLPTFVLNKRYFKTFDLFSVTSAVFVAKQTRVLFGVRSQIFVGNSESEDTAVPILVFNL